MSDFAIRAEGLGKLYRLGLSQPLGKKSVRTVLTGQLAYLTGARREPAPDEAIWAVREMSFEVQPGEVVGLIGANGAGKSTLLKMLSRITKPTEGRAWMNGRVGSLLEVGTGFHQELTGRENIYLSGTILGMRRGEIDRKFDEIVDFSGVEKFIDTPIKRYSSGMKVRLGFAVAAHLQPEILLVDEVLAVGDRNFHEKALGKMKNVVNAGRTVLFVSHYMTAIAQLCERVILVEHGQITMDGPANAAIERYLGLDATGANRSSNLEDYRRSSPEGAFGSSDLHFFDSIRVCGQPMPGALVLPARPQFVAEIEGDTQTREISDLRLELYFCTEEGVRVLSTATTWSPLGHFDAQGPLRLRCEIDRLALLPGRYLITVGVSSGKQSLEVLENVGIITIVPPRNENVEMTPKQKRDGYFWVDSRWSVEQTT